jgi:hypothetical protein
LNCAYVQVVILFCLTYVLIACNNNGKGLSTTDSPTIEIKDSPIVSPQNLIASVSEEDKEAIKSIFRDVDSNLYRLEFTKSQETYGTKTITADELEQVRSVRTPFEELGWWIGIASREECAMFFLAANRGGKLSTYLGQEKAERLNAIGAKYRKPVLAPADKAAIKEIFKDVDPNLYRLEFDGGKDVMGNKKITPSEITQIRKARNPLDEVGYIVLMVRDDGCIFILAATKGGKLESVLGQEKALRLKQIMAKYP